MASEEKEEMGSLFEGMVLFDPAVAEDAIPKYDLEVFPTSLSPAGPMSTASSSLPLDENLFSDLTLVTPIQTVDLHPPSYPSATTTATTTTTTRTPLISRKKKKGALRIGYGRGNPPSLPCSDGNQSRLDSPLLTARLPTSLTVGVGGEGASQREPTQNITGIIPAEEEEEDADFDINGDNEQVEEASPFSSLVKSDPHPGGILDSNIKERDLSSSDNEAGTAVSLEAPKKEEEKEAKAEEAGGSVEEKLQHIRGRILEKRWHIQELAASVSAMRKDSARRRRKAAEDVTSASVKYGELEKELQEACDTEDFERAERVSESLAAAEEEKQGFINSLKDAEADCDTVDLKMQEVLELQIAAEDECVSLWQHFKEEAARNADLLYRNVEALSSKGVNEWLQSTEVLAVQKMELEIESHIINDARFALNDSIKHSTEVYRKEKELLLKKQDVLAEDLEKLLAQVQEKEAEIAQNDSNINSIEKRITDVVAGFHKVQSSIDTKHGNLQSALSRVESDNEALSIKKKEFDDFLTQEEERVEKLRKLVTFSINETKACQELVELRKSLSLSILKSREDKVRLANIEEKFSEEVKILRQEVSATRAFLQELSLTKSSIQEEIGTFKQRIFFMDKRGPELEAEKKVAAAARNFKEAARIAAEAKTLSIEKERLQFKMEAAMFDLHKVEEEIEGTVKRLQESEGLIISKERDAAMARFERLRLIAAAATAERSAALQLDDIEEANILLAEADAANAEAKKLQQAYDINEKEFGNLPKDFISMEVITNLGGKQLAEMTRSLSLSTS